MVRAGRYGEREQLAIDHDLAIIGWEELPDLSSIKSPEDLQRLLESTYPNMKKNTLINYKAQLMGFLEKIKEGDLVALPLKSRPLIAVGRVTGRYAYRKDLLSTPLHVRPVKWLKEIPRTSFDQALLYSFGAFMTICQIRKNNAENIVKSLLEGKTSQLPAMGASEGTDIDEGGLEIEVIANDQIRSYMIHKFKGHGLPRLVGAILKAQGYHVTISPPGNFFKPFYWANV